jgi:hypothetical protein
MGKVMGREFPGPFLDVMYDDDSLRKICRWPGIKSCDDRLVSYPSPGNKEIS